MHVYYRVHNKYTKQQSSLKFNSCFISFKRVPHNQRKDADSTEPRVLRVISIKSCLRRIIIVYFDPDLRSWGKWCARVLRKFSGISSLLHNQRRCDEELRCPFNGVLVTHILQEFPSSRAPSGRLYLTGSCTKSLLNAISPMLRRELRDAKRARCNCI